MIDSNLALLHIGLKKWILLAGSRMLFAQMAMVRSPTGREPLEELHLASNLLKGTLPAALGSFMLLQELDVADNALSLDFQTSPKWANKF